MLKLDRLDWADGLAITTFGLQVGIRVTDASFLDSIKEILPFGWEVSSNLDVDYLYSVVVGSETAGGRIRRKSVVYSDILVLETSQTPSGILDALKRDIHLFVGEMAKGRIFLHSGVVGWKKKAVLLPGLTFTGKSTLVAALVRAGATYYSDEFAVLDADGRVHPFARPLSLRDTNSYSGSTVRAEEIGGTTGSVPLPVGTVIATTFLAGGTWAPRRQSSGEAILWMLANSLSARRQPEKVLPILTLVAEGADFFSGPRGEAAEVAGLILSLAGSNSSGILKLRGS